MELTDIKGIGQKRKQTLLKQGITTPKELANQNKQNTTLTQEMTKTKSTKIINNARNHIIQQNLKNTKINNQITLKINKKLKKPLIKKSIHSFLKTPNYLKNKINTKITTKPNHHIIKLEFLGHNQQEWNQIKQKMKRYQKGMQKQKNELSTDIAQQELQEIQKMDKKYQKYLKNIQTKQTKAIGKELDIQKLKKELKNQFGNKIYKDPLLSIIQQYSITDAPILNPNQEKTGITTGFNLAYFGDSGTGKTFSSVDIILGSKTVPAFGIPGRNRYCSGMTPAAFVRKGEPYQGRKFNFLIPEFREWFTHSDQMTEFLKLALERKKVRYETYKEEIQPYKFNSFFNVNYNVDVGHKNWNSISTDPHFRALRDRLLMRLHRMDKQRYKQIAESQTNLLLKKNQIQELAKKIRKHLTTIYALHNNDLSQKQKKKGIILTPDIKERLKNFRKTILEGKIVASPRIEQRMIQVAAAATLIEYWKRPKDPIPISKKAYEFAKDILEEELKTRRQEK